MKTDCFYLASKRRIFFCLLTSILLIQIDIARATTFLWTNTAGGNWSNTTNWSPMGLPGSGDTALITNAGTYTVACDVTNMGTVLLGAGGGPNGAQSLGITNKLSGSGVQGSIVVTNGGVFNADNNNLYGLTLFVENGGLCNSANNIYSQPVEITNAVFNCVNDEFQWTVTLDNGAQFISTNLFNATVEPTSTWQVNTGAVVTIDNGVFLIDGFVTNSGTINIETNGDLQLYNDQDRVMPYVNGELINTPGGLINLYGVPGIHNLKPGSGGGYELFVNQGTIARYGYQSDILVTEFDNSSGTVLNLYPSSMTVGYFQSYLSNLSGNFYATNGASFQFWGGEIPSAGDIPTNPAVVVQPLTLSGPGQFALYNGNFELSNDVPTNLLLEGGTLSLSANFQGGAITNLSLDGITLTNNLPVTGVLNDTNSILQGAFSVASGGVLNAYYTTYLDAGVTVAGGGAFNDQSGADINPPGSLTIQTGGTLLLNSSLTLNAAVTNYGVMTLTNNGGIGIDYNGTQDLGELVNASGGSIQIDAGGSGISGTQVGCYFINQGQIVKNFSSSGVNINVWDFDNTAGTVTNLQGILEVGNFMGALAGNFYASNGTTIQITGGIATNYLTPGTPLVLAGAGAYDFYQGYLDLPTNVVPGLILQGGTLALGSGFQGGDITNLTLDGILLTNTLPVTGTFNVTNSSVYGAFTVADGGSLNCFNSVNLYSAINVASGGLLTVNGGTALQSAGSLTIAAGGTLDAAATLSLYSSLTNFGTINITNFSIGLASALGGILNEPAANLFTFGGAGIGGAGYLVNDGSITKSVYTGSATINVTSFTNAGAITAQHGTLQLGTVTLLTATSLTLDLNSASDYGNFNFSGNAGLTGTLNVLTNSYIPSIGAVFNILTYGSYSGDFSGVNIPSGVGGWQTSYDSTVAQIEVGLPRLEPPVLSPTNLVLNATNGLYETPYVVLSTTNLTVPLADWTPLTTNNFPSNGKFSFTNSPATLPQQFFILASP
jgi:hypothetical protein